MSELAILVPKLGDEPPQRKRKLESSASASAYTYAAAVPVKSFSTVNDDSWWDDDYIDPRVEEEYDRQVRESDGFDVDRFHLPYGGISPNIMKDKYDYSYDIGLFGRLGLHCFNLENGTSLKLTGINKYNDDMIDFLPQKPSFMVQTEISRLKVPSGPRTTPTGPERRWKDDAVDDCYKGKMPEWWTEEELSNKGKFYELQGNEWLHMYAEFAFYFKCYAKGIDPRPFLPLEMKKIIVQTQENKEASQANNAIFYISFKGNGDPSGTPVEYQAIVRRTMDGLPGHICLEGECSAAYKCR